MKRVGVDVGGTFTDLIYVDERGGKTGMTDSHRTLPALDKEPEGGADPSAHHGETQVL